MLVQQQVLGLQVAVHDVLAVHVLHGEHDGAREEARGVVREPTRAAQVGEHLPSGHVLHQHEEVLSVLVRGKPAGANRRPRRSEKPKERGFWAVRGTFPDETYVRDVERVKTWELGRE